MSRSTEGGTRLYTYWHGVCRTSITTIAPSSPGSPYRCPNCGGAMAYIGDRRADGSAHDNAILARGFIRNGIVPELTTPDRRKKCSTCRQPMDPGVEIYLPGAGRFCSTPCADRGAAAHEAQMFRLEKLYEEKPWLRPEPKERAS